MSRTIFNTAPRLPPHAPEKPGRHGCGDGESERPASASDHAPTRRIASRRLDHPGAEPRQRLLDLAAARLRGVAALALLVDDLFRRTGEEIGIGELHVDLVDVAGELLQFPLQAGDLGVDVNA